MELKIEGDTFSLSGQNTPEGLEQALRELAQRWAAMTNSRTQDTLLPVMLATKIDVRQDQGTVALWLCNQFGWTVFGLTPSATIGVVHAMLGKLVSMQAEPEIPSSHPLQ